MVYMPTKKVKSVNNTDDTINQSVSNDDNSNVTKPDLKKRKRAPRRT